MPEFRQFTLTCFATSSLTDGSRPVVRKTTSCDWPDGEADKCLSDTEQARRVSVRWLRTDGSRPGTGCDARQADVHPACRAHLPPIDRSMIAISASIS
jgi:hypothetical protein